MAEPDEDIDCVEILESEKLLLDIKVRTLGQESSVIKRASLSEEEKVAAEVNAVLWRAAQGNIPEGTGMVALMKSDSPKPLTIISVICGDDDAMEVVIPSDVSYELKEFLAAIVRSRKKALADQPREILDWDSRGEGSAGVAARPKRSQ